MRDLRRFEKQIQRLQDEVAPKEERPGFNQLSEQDAHAVTILARASRDLHGKKAILRRSFQDDETALAAVCRKARALAVEYQALPFAERSGITEKFRRYLLKHHRKHIDLEADARNREQRNGYPHV